VTAAQLPEHLGDEPWYEKVDLIAPQPLHEALWDAALHDLVALRARSRGALGVYLATPHPERPGVSPEPYAEFIEQTEERLGLPAPVQLIEHVTHDHAAGIGALARAALQLIERRVDVALVVGIDSLLHSTYVEAMAGQGVLKLPDRAHGLFPGEGAAALILERASDAAARGAPVRARLGALALDTEATPLGERYPIRGEAGSRVVAAVLEAEARPTDIHRVLIDMTGERWRAIEWSLIETRCLGELPPGWQIWHPADCFGDLGAATGLVHAGLAVRAFARGYAGPGGVLLYAASPRGQRAAATLWPPGKN
jgi:3-oxoacyl-[acyl-carrier-protein] synthase-1